MRRNINPIDVKLSRLETLRQDELKRESAQQARSEAEHLKQIQSNFVNHAFHVSDVMELRTRGCTFNNMPVNICIISYNSGWK